jgi:two-component system NtrC family sensor kinase
MPGLLPSPARAACLDGSRIGRGLTGKSPVIKRRPIRNKLLLGGLLVGLMVAVLSASSFLGVYSYRRLVRALSCRASELPRASELDAAVGSLRLVHARALAGESEFGLPMRSAADGVEALEGTADGDAEGDAEPVFQQTFTGQLARVRRALSRYCDELSEEELDEMPFPFGDRSRERETAAALAACLDAIGSCNAAAPPEQGGPDPETDVVAWQRRRLLDGGPHLETLARLSAALPTFLQERLHDLSHEVRSGYRTLIVTTWASATAAAVLLAALGASSYRWVFRPLRLLGHGSRRVAAGDFKFRLKLDSSDEMAELAAALNDMTQRFEEIRDDLDRQVQMRTREVIRSEQLASVGFLAAGVAHEINNPLASIAMCAESLESRLGGLAGDDADGQVVRRYLELIQNEAFRCKGITEKLLDFSRLGEVRRQATALLALVADVADMLRHVGRFAGRSIEIADGPDVLVMVNPQEIKQVVLNLLVNALDAIDEAGHVHVAVRRVGRESLLTITDDGCGMSGEVLEHLFEPFFTRRRSGQGTGLGLSIVHRIVADHGGRIEATSAGEGQGATFRVTLPLAAAGGGGLAPAGDQQPQAA